MKQALIQSQPATAPSTRVLRVGAQGLAAAEAGLLRALVTLIANGRDDFPWVYAERDADAVVMRESAASARLVLRMGGTFGERLEAPLAAGQLEACLDRAAARVAPQAANDMAGNATERYRLRRWPQAELLRGDRQRVRLATLLSRQSLTLGELAELSQMPASDCLAFTRLLQEQGLLQVSQPLAAPARPARPSEAEAAAPAAAARWSLVRSIRRTLGLAGGAR